MKKGDVKKGDVHEIRRFSFRCWVDNGRISLGAPVANVIAQQVVAGDGLSRVQMPHMSLLLYYNFF